MTFEIGWAFGHLPISVSIIQTFFRFKGWNCCINLTYGQIQKWNQFSKKSISSAGNPYTAAEALLMLLESPPEPLVSPMEDECLYAESFDKCCEIIKILSGPKKNTFLYICMFLNELLKHKEHNRLDALKLGKFKGTELDWASNQVVVPISDFICYLHLFSTFAATLFGRVMLKPHGKSKTYRALSEKDSDERRTTFMQKFLSNDIKDFARDVLSAPQ